MNPENLQQILDIEDKVNSLYNSSTIPRDVETAFIERLGVNNAIKSTLNGMQVFTASGTFTVPSGYTKFVVEGVGGGAGGGSATTSATYANSGGAGAYCKKFIDLTNVATVTVTVGTGGTGHSSGSPGDGNDGNDTTFGAYFTAGKGLGNGTGGTASNGDLNINGGNQGIGYVLYGAGSTTNSTQISGMGGKSFFGHGTNNAVGSIGSQANGNNATGYGDGASGGASGTAGSVTSGGNGTDGLVIIYW